MTQPPAIATFLSDFDWTAYAGARYSIAAIREGGETRNLHCRLLLDVEEPSAEWKYRGHVDNLVVARDWLPIPNAREVLAELEDSSAFLADTNILFQNPADQRPYSWVDNPISTTHPSEFEWRARRLDGFGGDMIDQRWFQSIGSRLVNAVPRPFSGWESLCEFLGHGVRIDQSRRAEFHCFAPIYARIKSIQAGFASEKIQVTIESRGRFSLGLFLLFTPTNGNRVPLRSNAEEWTRIDGSHRLAMTAYPAGTGPVRVQLVHAQDLVEERLAGIPSPFAVLHGSLDPEGAWLREQLEAGKKRSGHHQLTAAVVAILSLAGIPTVDYCTSGLQHAVDFIASVGPRRFVVGECTTGPAEGDKVEEVAARAAALAASLSSSPEPADCSSAVVIPLSEVTISQSVAERAARLRVALVGRERLAEMLAAILRGESSNVVFRILSRPMSLPR